MTDHELLLAISNIMDKKIKPMENSIRKLELSTESMKASIRKLELSNESMKASIKKLELANENDIIPRLQNIESCYISTYKRYSNGAE